MKLMYGQRIQITEKNIMFFNAAASFFENQDLIEAVSNFRARSISRDSVLRPFMKGYPVTDLTSEITFIASNFDYFLENQNRVENLKNLPMLALDTILSNTDLVYSNESALFSLIKSIVEVRGPEFASLFSHIVFENITAHDMDQFFQLVKPESISGALWLAISQRLMCNIQKPDDEEEDIQQQQIQRPYYPQEYLPSQANQMQQNNKIEHIPYTGIPLAGIFMYLGQDDNPQYLKMVSLDGGGGDKKKYLCRLLEQGNARFWNNSTTDKKTGKIIYRKEDQWITIEFKKHSVLLEHYTLAILTRQDHAQPKHWVLFGSNDEINWDLLHEVTDGKELAQQGTSTYQIPNNSVFYSHFKIVQLENCCNKQSPEVYKFGLTHIEFFGKFKPLAE